MQKWLDDDAGEGRTGPQSATSLNARLDVHDACPYIAHRASDIGLMRGLKDESNLRQPEWRIYVSSILADAQDIRYPALAAVRHMLSQHVCAQSYNRSRHPLQSSHLGAVILEWVQKGPSLALSAIKHLGDSLFGPASHVLAPSWWHWLLAPEEPLDCWQHSDAHPRL